LLLRADEFLVLVNAARIPINQIQRYQRYFSLKSAITLHSYGFRTRLFTPPHTMVIGRDAILNRLYALMTKQRNMVISGHAGIGKTAVADRALRRYEMSHGQPLLFGCAPH
jgi:Cdc6-like AAA superfamily ATPase